MGSGATKESIAASAKTLGTQEIHVPEWGGTVRIRELSGVDRGIMTEAWDRYRKAFNGQDSDWSGYEAFLIANTMVDENGKRIYADGEVMALNQTPARILDRVARFVMRINGLGQYAEQELPKSCGPTPNGSAG